MEEIIDFLGEYAETLEAMEQKQIEKLGLLMTRELDKVEADHHDAGGHG